MSEFERPALHEKEDTIDVDWAEFKARATEFRQAADARAHLSEAETQRLFAERAARLSTPKEETDGMAASLQVISFEVAGRSFGVDVHALQEVYDAEHITVIPCTPQVFVGLLNYRGEVLTVLDLASLLGLEKKEGGTKSGLQGQRVLVVKQADLKAGILVERLHKMLSIPLASVEPLSSFFTQKNKLIRSQTLIAGRPLLLLDPMALLSDARLNHSEER